MVVIMSWSRMRAEEAAAGRILPLLAGAKTRHVTIGAVFVICAMCRAVNFGQLPISPHKNHRSDMKWFFRKAEWSSVVATMILIRIPRLRFRRKMILSCVVSASPTVHGHVKLSRSLLMLKLCSQRQRPMRRHRPSAIFLCKLRYCLSGMRSSVIGGRVRRAIRLRGCFT